jgi:MoxR-like ATPase
LRFDRVRCTPKLTPHDIVGLGAVPDGGHEVAGPIFANIVLVDDFSRLSPSSDALIQQAIQDNRIVLDGRRHSLPDPFMILATRYPEIEAADSIVEHHDDRFMMKVSFAYPAYDEEYALAEKLAVPEPIELEQVVAKEDLAAFRRLTSHIVAPPHVIHYALRLVRATRIHEGDTPDFIYEWVDFGAGPRAAHHLTLAAKIRAGLYGRGEATTEDIKSVVHPILRHRIITNSNARSTGVTVDRVIRRLLYEVPERQEGDDRAPGPLDD